MTDAEFSQLIGPNAQLLRDGVEDHVNRGQGLMVAGHHPLYRHRRPRFVVRRAAA